MNLRQGLVFLAIVLTVFIGIVSMDVLVSIVKVLLGLDGYWYVLIACAIALQFLGHFFRTLRAKTVIDQVKYGKTADQFKALAAGYLFNVLLPFRAGELLRALLISLRLHISNLYTLTVVVFERVIDLLVVGVSVIVIAGFMSGSMALTLLIAALGTIIFCLAALVGLMLLVRENKFLMRTIWQATGFFNDTLRNKARFKIWSLIVGLQNFMNNHRAVKKYVGLTVISWLCYLGAMALVVVPLLATNNLTSLAVATASPYVAASMPANPLPLMDGYAQLIDPVATNDMFSSPTLYVYFSWMLLTGPMVIVGLFCLFLIPSTVARRSRKATPEAFTNKLLRRDDISQEFPVFLDSYFSGHNLARILHKLETSGELSLVKFFKGGSDAITILVMKGSQLFVKKIIPLEYEPRLKAQYDWLQRHQSMSNLVRVLGEQRAGDYYAIDLEYDPANIPFFEYLHHNSFKQSVQVLEAAWGSLYEHLYKSRKEPGYYPKKRDAYVERHIFDCVAKAAEVHDDLRKALELPHIVINGRTYDNLYQIIAKIKQCEPAWRDIATFQTAPQVDGDIAIDNILVSSKTGKPLIIDPAPDGNIVEGPVFDMSKLMQSFYCGYEFLFRDEDPVVLDDNRINYRDQTSYQYVRIKNHVIKKMAPAYLTEPEQRAMVFHAGALHIRRLKHQVNYNYQNTLKFYAVGVKTLNEFLQLYRQDDSAVKTSKADVKPKVERVRF